MNIKTDGRVYLCSVVERNEVLSQDRASVPLYAISHHVAQQPLDTLAFPSASARSRCSRRSCSAICWVFASVERPQGEGPGEGGASRRSPGANPKCGAWRAAPLPAQPRSSSCSRRFRSAVWHAASR